jgi:hypothetical protein
MNSIFRNIIAVVAGAILGSMINMGLVAIGGSVIPPPAGADVTTMEGLMESIHLFRPINFLFPFLAHALGTLAGAALAGMIAAHNNKLIASLVVGLFFLIGGIANVVLLPSPLWFNVVDLTLAYFPMAYLGFLVAKWEQNRKTQNDSPVI